MHSPSKYDLQAAGQADNEGADDSELNILRDIFRMLPHGVTVQDGHGRLLLANDAAAAQLQIDEAGPSSGAMEHRRETGTELLRAGQGAIVEESVTNGAATQVLLTSHRPVRIAERDLLLSSSADITGQKAFEDTLFRAAYYDELTGLPSRRVIEHRVNKPLQGEDNQTAGFALFFHNFSTFLGRRGLYLEDLFVRPAFRRRGYGRALLVHLARLAVERGCGRFEWTVLDWNAPAIGFYQQLGAQILPEWRITRVTGVDLASLAAQPLLPTEG